MGYLLAQQLVSTGEHVVNVPATLAARTRLLGSGRSSKSDPNDALSVALTALRATGLNPVRPVGHSEILRLMAKRNIDIGNQRYALLLELDPGGISKEINASDVDRFLAEVHPATPAAQLRYDLAAELLDDIRRLDGQLKSSHKRIRTAVAASGTSVTDVFGIGPIIAAMLIGFSGDITRFANREPLRRLQRNGADRVQLGRPHRPSPLHTWEPEPQPRPAALCQLRQRHSEGRAYFDRRVSEGKTKKEALRALKRKISNTAYRHLVADAATRRG